MFGRDCVRAWTKSFAAMVVAAQSGHHQWLGGGVGGGGGGEWGVVRDQTQQLSLFVVEDIFQTISSDLSVAAKTPAVPECLPHWPGCRRIRVSALELRQRASSYVRRLTTMFPTGLTINRGSSWPLSLASLVVNPSPGDSACSGCLRELRVGSCACGKVPVVGSDAE